METMENVIAQYLEGHPPAKVLFEGLKSLGNLYLIGGVLREYRDNDGIINLRDIDLISDAPKSQYENFMNTFNPEKNAFGGFKVHCPGLIVDIWRLEETWAYTNQKIKCSKSNYAKFLPQTVFLNMDAIVYDLKNDLWNDDIYNEAVRSGVLDVVLEENPQTALNIVRCFVLQRRYGMELSPDLCRVIIDYCYDNPNAVQELYNIQLGRYKKEILTLRELQENLLHVTNKFYSFM